MRDKAMTQLPLLGMQPRAFRDAYWATTFRALGSVMHLVQDMGNPQHTRDASQPIRNTPVKLDCCASAESTTTKTVNTCGAKQAFFRRYLLKNACFAPQVFRGNTLLLAAALE
jgi:hypothetical protein